MVERAILIAGPTASGKSALALDLARKTGGEIVNADSMQVYRELRIITARPGEAEERLAPHHLYGVLSVRETCSVGRWLALLAPVLADIWGRGRTAILVGGTGLYFRAALDGLASVPDIPDSVRQKAQGLLEEIGAPGLHRELGTVDPEMAARLRPSDPQRVLRAYEVMEATGRSLAEWQGDAAPALLADAELERIALLPPRDLLYARIDARFEAMMEEGAQAEAATLKEMGIAMSHPVMKALGIPSLLACLDGAKTREEAVREAKTLSRRYAKRQMTWIRHQFADWEVRE
jgi:tRNA dimethylallyltransferase